jgi:2-(1,2-epoxy-1,2-dihydrophenyl)acetyl-CoA isomerase
MSHEDVTLEISGTVATLTLNRPEHRNSFSEPMMEALLTQTQRAVHAPEVRVIVVTGAGSAFSVGGDLGDFATGAFAPANLTPAQSASQLRRHVQVVELLRNSDAVSVAAVHGPCAGAGLGLALACDIRVSSTTAVFRTAFLDAALTGDYGVMWSLVRLVGEAKAKELFFLNPKITAEAAHATGLVSEVVNADGLKQRVAEISRSLTQKSPGTLRALKRAFRDLPDNLASALDVESQRQKERAYAEDAQEAAAAFLEKRRPVFENNDVQGDGDDSDGSDGQGDSASHGGSAPESEPS